MMDTVRSTTPACGMDWLRLLEEDLTLFDPAVRDFALWPVFRFQAWQLISNVQFRATHGPVRMFFRKTAWAPGLLAYGGWSFLQRRRLRKRRFDLLFLSQEAHRSVQRADGWWDPYLDDVAAHPDLAGRVLRIERRDFPISRFRTVAQRHLFTDLQLLDQARRHGFSRPAEPMRQAQRTCDVLFTKLRQLAVPFDSARVQTFRARCARAACRFYHESTWYERLLREFRPAVVALVDAYNQHGLVAAAKTCGIPVIEFQHGIIHPDHPGYVWFSNLAAVRGRLPIPDRIATYGEYWSQLLMEEGFWQPADVPIVGSARMDWTRAQSPPRESGPSLRIVFTSQFTTRARTIPLLEEFLRLADQAGLDHSLTVKVHRAELGFMREYEALIDISPRVTILSPYEGDTLRLIAGTDVHVSGWSTCHFEAVGLGTPTIVLDFPGPDRLAGLNGFTSVFRATNAQGLLDCTQRIRQSQNSSAETLQRDSNRLFRESAADNAVSLLLEYVNG